MKEECSPKNGAIVLPVCCGTASVSRVAPNVAHSSTRLARRRRKYSKRNVNNMMYTSTTLYYKVLLQYYSVLQSATPVLLCTTKYYSSTTVYYKVLFQYYTVLQSTIPHPYETALTMRGATGVTIQLHQILRLPHKMNLKLDPRHL